jgi:hypothetical protein
LRASVCSTEVPPVCRRPQPLPASGVSWRQAIRSGVDDPDRSRPLDPAPPCRSLGPAQGTMASDQVCPSGPRGNPGATAQVQQMGQLARNNCGIALFGAGTMASHLDFFTMVALRYRTGPGRGGRIGRGRVSPWLPIGHRSWKTLPERRGTARFRSGGWRKAARPCRFAAGNPVSRRLGHILVVVRRAGLPQVLPLPRLLPAGLDVQPRLDPSELAE